VKQTGPENVFGPFFQVVDCAADAPPAAAVSPIDFLNAQLTQVTQELDEALEKLERMPCGHARFEQHREMHASATPYCTVCRINHDYRVLEEEEARLDLALEKTQQELDRVRTALQEASVVATKATDRLLDSLPGRVLRPLREAVDALRKSGDIEGVMNAQRDIIDAALVLFPEAT
jgi:hypothetical protein